MKGITFLYRKLKPGLVLFCMFVWSLHVHAQQELPAHDHPTSTGNIPMVEVVVEKQHYLKGISTQTMDSATLASYPAGNVGEVLQNHSHVNIKSYGPGNLASTSIRGGTAHQTSVFWNGVNIQSPLLGQSDLAYLPASCFDAVTVIYGAGGVLFGNSTQAGSIHLNNVARFKPRKELQFQTNGGSFGLLGGNLGLTFSDSTYSCDATVYHTQAENDFKVLENGTVQTNADWNTTGFKGNLTLRSKLKNTSTVSGSASSFSRWSMHMWFQNSERGIGSVITGAPSQARLENAFGRLNTSYYYIKNRFSVTARSALFVESMDYNDHQTDLHSYSVFNTLTNEIETSYLVSNSISVEGGVLNTTVVANSENYEGEIIQNRLAPFLLFKYAPMNGKVQFTSGIRKLYMPDYHVPLTANLNGAVKLTKEWSWNVQLAKNYRVPTLNDLYYMPYGRQDLLPEDGWNLETGLNYQKNEHWDVSLTSFQNQYRNMIVWMPDATTGYWQPTNIHARTYGVEGALKAFGTLNEQWKWHFSTTGTLQKSINSVTGYSMIYVPSVLANGMFTVRNNKFRVSVIQNYTGRRYVSTNEGSALKAFYLSNVFIEYRTDIKRVKSALGFKCNNLFNRNYQNVINYPMPGRNYELFLRLNTSLRKDKSKIITSQ